MAEKCNSLHIYQGISAPLQVLQEKWYQVNTLQDAFLLPIFEISTNNYSVNVMLSYSVDLMTNLCLSFFPVSIKITNNCYISLNREELALFMETWHHVP